MTNEEILEAKRLAKAATPGPWSAECFDEELDLWQVPEALVSASADADYPDGRNAVFIAAARTLVPALADDLLAERAAHAETKQTIHEQVAELDALSVALMNREP